MLVEQNTMTLTKMKANKLNTLRFPSLACVAEDCKYSCLRRQESYDMVREARHTQTV